MKTKIILCCFILIFFSEIVYTQENSDPSGLDQNTTKKVDSNNHKQNSEKNNLKKKALKNWPATFVPSEKINADSSVSFPVDI